MGFYILVFLGATPVGSPLIGWLADVIGVRETVALCGAITTIGAAAIYVISKKRLKRFEYAV